MLKPLNLLENLTNMKIACVSYRSWANKIYNRLIDKYKDDHKFFLIRSKEEFNKEELIKFNPDLILWYGWSWIVDEYFTKNYISVMLHPSPLPKYRGGSPIQNQIINGEKKSSVSLFKMNNFLDEGDIYFQREFSLEGSLDDIFFRITEIGFLGTCRLIDGEYKVIKQDHSKATYFKRRKPMDSEITIHELKTKSATYIHNKIRMLNDPYPNAFIKCANGEKIYLIKSKL